MDNKAKIGAGAVLALGLSLSSAFAESGSAPGTQPGDCGDRDTMIRALAGHYGQERQSFYVHPDGSLIELFANEATGSFTNLVTGQDRDWNVCISETGHSYKEVPEDKKHVVFTAPVNGNLPVPQNGQCLDTGTMIRGLAQHLGQVPQSFYTRPDETLVGIFANEVTGSFTRIVAAPGEAEICAEEIGHSYQNVSESVSTGMKR